jgi:hypothetical protein
MSTGSSKISPLKVVPDIEKIASSSIALRRFYHQLHTRNIGQDVLVKYEQDIQAVNDRLNRLFLEERAKVTAKVTAKERAKVRASVALEMLKNCEPDTKILEYTKITSGELAKLKLRKGD